MTITTTFLFRKYLNLQVQLQSERNYITAKGETNNLLKLNLAASCIL